jgi:hypothetical protein
LRNGSQKLVKIPSRECSVALIHNLAVALAAAALASFARLFSIAMLTLEPDARPSAPEMNAPALTISGRSTPACRQV